MAERWIALHCGDESDALLMNRPNAFLLLTQIAMRAKWKPCSITKLKAGQAFIGDWREAGLSSEKVYRNAKAFLAECGLATFEGRPKGTIATLMDKRIFSFERDDKGEQGASKGRTEGEQGATNHTDTQIHGDTDTLSLVIDPPEPPKHPKKKTKNIVVPPLPFDSESFHSAWSDWEQHRKEKKNPLTPLSIQKQFKELSIWGESRAIAAINFSIRKGWEGIYEDRNASTPSLFTNGKSNRQFTAEEQSKHSPEHLAYCAKFKLDPDSPDANIKIRIL